MLCGDHFRIKRTQFFKGVWNGGKPCCAFLYGSGPGTMFIVS